MKISELMDMKGRVALITGGAGYIGFSIAEALAEAGADIVLLDFNTEICKEKSSILEKHYGVKVLPLRCDLEKSEDIEESVSRVQDEFGRLDVVVNCAALVGTSGVKGWAVPLIDQSIDTWRRALEVNLTAPFYLIQKSIPLLSQSHNASIINVGSIYGFAGMDMSLYEGLDYITPAAYAASKGGLTQLTKYLATALAPDIRVNTLSPGGIERGQSESFQERYCRKTPLNRMGTEVDLKGAALFLASDMSAYVTGQNIIVDGGWSV